MLLKRLPQASSNQYRNHLQINSNNKQALVSRAIWLNQYLLSNLLKRQMCKCLSHNKTSSLSILDSRKREVNGIGKTNSTLRISRVNRLKNLRISHILHSGQLSHRNCSLKISSCIVNAQMPSVVSCRANQKPSWKSSISFSNGQL